MILYAVIWKSRSEEAFGYVFENHEDARETLRSVHVFHPDAVIIEIPIKGLIL